MLNVYSPYLVLYGTTGRLSKRRRSGSLNQVLRNPSFPLAKVIADSAVKGAPVLQKIATNNVAALKKCIEVCKAGLKSHIRDERIAEQDGVINFDNLSTTLENSAPGKLLKPFVDNPIIHGIMNFASTWILRGCCISDDVMSLPGAEAITDLTSKIAEAVQKLIADEGNDFLRFFNDVIAKIKDTLAGRRNLGEFFTVLLSDAFWTVFDTMEGIAKTFLDVFGPLISTILEVCAGEIKIPGVSTLWEVLNGTKFSIINILSMNIAQLLYLLTMLWKQKLPFDIMRPWSEFLPDPDSIVLINLGPPTIPAFKKQPPKDGSSDEPSKLTPVSLTAPAIKFIHRLSQTAAIEVAATVLSSVGTVLSTFVAFPRAPMSVPGKGNEPPYGTGGYFESTFPLCATLAALMALQSHLSKILIYRLSAILLQFPDGIKAFRLQGRLNG